MNTITLLKVRKATGTTVHLRKDGTLPALCGAVPPAGTGWVHLAPGNIATPMCLRCHERAPKAKGISTTEQAPA